MIYFNGKLVPDEEVRVSPYDRGVLTGLGVFETLVAYRGQPFAVTRHLSRLEESAEIVGIPLPSLDDLADVMKELLVANGHNELEKARLRLTVTAGEAIDNSRPNLILLSTEAPSYPDRSNVFVVPYPRNENGLLVGAKSMSYAENVIALAEAHQNGADEAILPNSAGSICEGTGSNLFILRGGELYTPSLASGCLAGVTRALAMDCAFECGTPVHETEISLEDFLSSEGAFLTSTTREILPIQTVNGAPLDVPMGAFQPVIDEFQKLKRSNPDP